MADFKKGFKKVMFPDYHVTKEIEYEAYYDSLKKYKVSHQRPGTANSINVDVNNFMYLFDARSKENGISMFDINNYLITTDSRYCGWAQSTLPGTTPVCVLPSVWYSLLLKFNGRSNNDYRAFCLFLNLRYKTEKNLEIIKKAEILAIVQNADEPHYIKEQILENIYYSLNDYAYDDTPTFIVEKAENDVIAAELARIRETEGNPLVSKGELCAYQKIASDTAEKKYLRWRWIIKVQPKLKIVFGCVFVAFVLYLVISNNVYTFINDFYDKNTGLDISHWIAIITVCVTIINGCILNPLRQRLEKLNLDDMTQKELYKLKAKYKFKD